MVVDVAGVKIGCTVVGCTVFVVTVVVPVLVPLVDGHINDVSLFVVLVVVPVGLVPDVLVPVDPPVVVLWLYL